MHRKSLYVLLIVTIALVGLVAMIPIYTHGKLLANVETAAIILAGIAPVWAVVAPVLSPQEGKDVDYDTTVADLRTLVLEREAQQRLRLLDDALEPALTKLEPADFVLSYRNDTTPVGCGWNESFEFFWNLRPRRRMVVLGEPGAGKTLFLLEVIRQAGMSNRSAIPILIRLNIANWRDNRSFRDFISEQIMEEWRVPKSLAYKIYDRRHVVPLLDGLDELDLPGNDPIRGCKIIERLNSSSEDSYPIDLPLILTCRTEYFENLERLQSRRKEVIGLQGALTYVLARLGCEQIMSFLRANLTDEARKRWTLISEALADDDPHFVAVLGSPWRLMLAFCSFAFSGRPASLINRENSSQEIEMMLLPYFFSVALNRQRKGVTLSRFAGLKFWARPFGSKPGEVVHWLKQIASHLSAGEGRNGISGQFFIHQVYQMAPKRLEKMLFVSTMLTVACSVTAVLSLVAISGSHSVARTVAICFTVLFIAISVYARMKSDSGAPVRSTLANDLRSPRGVRDLAISMLAALAVSAFTAGSGHSFALRALGGLACGLIAGIAFGFVQAARIRARDEAFLETRKPADPMRSRIGTSVIIGAFFAALYFLGLILDGATGTEALVFSVCALLTFILYGLPVTSVAWLRYKPALTVLVLQRRLPWRFTTFLDWSYNAGLMRTSGLAYQFRHDRFQQWIAETEESKLLPPMK